MFTQLPTTHMLDWLVDQSVINIGLNQRMWKKKDGKKYGWRLRTIGISKMMMRSKLPSQDQKQCAQIGLVRDGRSIKKQMRILLSGIHIASQHNGPSLFYGLPKKLR